MKYSLAVRACLLFSALVAGCKHYEPAPLSSRQSASALEARSLADPGLKQFAEKWAQPPPASWPPAQWDFATLTLVAFYFHPALDLARAQWSVAKAGIQTAGGRPNPIVSAVPGYSMNPQNGSSPWFPMLSVDIPIQTAGKRGYRVAQAQKLAEAARLNITSAAWQVRSNLRLTLLDYEVAQQRAQRLQQQLELQQQIVALLEQRLQAGTVARTDVTLQRLALARTGIELADAQRVSAEARVRIADAVGVSAKAIAGAKFELPLAVSAESAVELTSAQARDEALLGRPDILAALADYAATESLLQFEIARQYPDIHLNPGYQFDEGEHKWSLGLSAELPVLNQNQGPIAEAKARREEAGARFVALQSAVLAAIERALAARAAALEQVAQQSRLTGLAREQSASVAAMFQAGAADKLELSSAQFESSVSELAYLDAQFKAQLAIAQLEDAIKRPLEAWPPLEQGRAAQAQAKSP